MVSSKRPTGRAVSIPVGLAIGAAGSLTVTLICSAILAYLIDQERLAITTMGYGVMLIIFLAAAVGSALASGKIKHLRLQICLLSGAVFFIILLGIHALFFGGRYSGMGITAIVILLGSLVPVLPRMQKGRGVRRLYRKGGVR